MSSHGRVGTTNPRRANAWILGQRVQYSGLEPIQPSMHRHISSKFRGVLSGR
jgi:hypothetical protein